MLEKVQGPIYVARNESLEGVVTKAKRAIAVGTHESLKYGLIHFIF